MEFTGRRHCQMGVKLGRLRLLPKPPSGRNPCFDLLARASGLYGDPSGWPTRKLLAGFFHPHFQLLDLLFIAFVDRVFFSPGQLNCLAITFDRFFQLAVGS